MKSIFKQISQNWKSLTNAQILAWNALALSQTDKRLLDTSAKLTDYNSFENPNIVKPAPFKEVKINKGTMKVKLPAKSIVTLELQ